MLDRVFGKRGERPSDRTVEATLSGGTDAEQFQLMLQRLLTQRFLITLHREQKVVPVYRLKVAKNGPRLMPAETLPQYQDDDEAKEARLKNAGDGLEKMIADIKAGNRPLNLRTSDMLRATPERFAEMLSDNVDRPLRDMTQLEGEYHFHLDWTPESAMHNDPSAISIFTAVQDQLGLRLEGGNEQIDMLVIDKAEKTPVSN